jgi:pSer/pThr/pTyr-binding forkhead associated (FHA) protein
MIRCPRCGKDNAADILVCQWCRSSLSSAGPSPARPAPASESGEPAPLGVEKLRAAVQRLVAERHEEPHRSKAPPAEAPRAPAPRPAPSRPAAPSAPAASPIHGRVTSPDGAPRIHTGPGAFRLVVVNNDGSDRAVYSLGGEQVDIGRVEGDLLFDDPYLAPRHARIEITGGAFTLFDLETRNGVFRRLRAATDLVPGDTLLMGRQVLQFEAVAKSENELGAAVSDGIALLGTPVPPAWGRLRLLALTGLTQDVFHLSRGEIVVGREHGNVVFSDDEFMSRRHAKLTSSGGRTTIEDLGTANGTFVRVRGPYKLTAGDQLRMGNVLLRFEV